MPFPIKRPSDFMLDRASYDLDLDSAIRIGRGFTANGSRSVYVVKGGANEPGTGDGYGLHCADFPAYSELAAIITPIGVLSVLLSTNSLADAERSAVEVGGCVVGWHKEPNIWRVVSREMAAIRSVEPKIGSWYAPAQSS